MLIRLLRNKPKANAITGRLILGDAPLTLATLEPWQYAIPAGCYRLRLTYSPTFQELLPLLDGVLGYARQPHNGIRRTGIRIHAGNTIADSRGCILVGEADASCLIASSPNSLSPALPTKIHPRESAMVLPA